MKNSIYILIFFLSIASVTAQKKRKFNKEKFRAYKVSYLTEKLDLTEKEAEKFWPIYNAYDKKIHELRYKERYILGREVKEAGGIDSLSEKQSKEITLKIINSKKEAQKLTATFYSKLPKILSYKKILRLEFAEKSFHSKLIRKLRKKRKSIKPTKSNK